MQLLYLLLFLGMWLSRFIQQLLFRLQVFLFLLDARQETVFGVATSLLETWQVIPTQIVVQLILARIHRELVGDVEVAWRTSIADGLVWVIFFKEELCRFLLRLSLDKPLLLPCETLALVIIRVSYALSFTPGTAATFLRRILILLIFSLTLNSHCFFEMMACWTPRLGFRLLDASVSALFFLFRVSIVWIHARVKDTHLAHFLHLHEGKQHALFQVSLRKGNTKVFAVLEERDGSSLRVYETACDWPSLEGVQPGFSRLKSDLRLDIVVFSPVLVRVNISCAQVEAEYVLLFVKILVDQEVLSAQPNAYPRVVSRAILTIAQSVYPELEEVLATIWRRSLWRLNGMSWHNSGLQWSNCFYPLAIFVYVNVLDSIFVIQPEVKSTCSFQNSFFFSLNCIRLILF